MSSLESCLARLDLVFANASTIITLILDGSLEEGDSLPCARCGISRSHATVENTTIGKTHMT